MALQNTFIPHRGYFSSPFCKWQGPLAGEHAIELAARCASHFLTDRKIPGEELDELILGITVPQQHAFYGAPWAAGLMGLSELTGPTIAQACATSVRMLSVAAASIECGQRSTVLALACDRTSNGPHLYYPDPKGPGGRGVAEDWVWDNFGRDPHGKVAMIQTAENVAREAGLTREAQEEVTLLRHAQYADALADDRAFQRRFLLPVTVGRGKRAVEIDADAGVHPATPEGLRGLKPALEGGTVTFGCQTHPADGNAGMILCAKDDARRLGDDDGVTIQVLGFGSGRVKKGFMPMAVVPAARAALEDAGVTVEALGAIKTHNPFAVNDLFFAREMAIAPEAMNHFGCSLVYGHPQAPMGLRAVAELIEELVLAGGGLGLFSGCAAGDSAMAVVLRVS